MGEFSLTHWLIILVVVLIFVGPSKLPGLGKGLGEAIRGFKKGLNDDHPPQDATNSNVDRQLSQGQNTETSTVKKDEKIHS